MTVGEILGELIGHFAYDVGCTDSGIHDEVRKKQLADLLRKKMENENKYRIEEADWFMKEFLSPDALQQGYGIEDVASFHNWLENDLP